MVEAQLTDVHLTEQTSRDCPDLSREDAEYLRSRPENLRVSRRFDDAGFVVNTGPYVGVARMPSGRTLRIAPKVDVFSVFFMLSRVLDFPFDDGLAQFSRFEELLEFLAQYFCDLVDDVMQKGLYRAYLESEENLGVVRGRLDFREDLRRNAIQRQRAFCRFSEFSWDVPENRVLRQVAHQLSGWGFSNETANRLALIDAQLGEVSVSNYGPGVIDTFVYHRLNEHYRSPHSLARLFMQSIGLGDEAGAIEFRTFLVNMNTLFEAFIRVMIARAIRPPHTVDERHSSLSFDAACAVYVHPDITIRRAGRITGVADCKYQSAAPGDFAADHLYQILAYNTISATSRGFLIYPRHVLEVEDELAVVGSPVRIRRVSIDLGVPPAAIQAQTERLALAIAEDVHLVAAA